MAIAQKVDEDLANLLKNNNSGLLLDCCPQPEADLKIYGDTATEWARPYITPDFRKNLFEMMHY